MLIDDQDINNTFHEWVIKKNNAAENIISKESGLEGLDYLTNPQNPKPDLIFLDINMPGMSGWEFLEEYQKNVTGNSVVVMLTSSDDPKDIALAKNYPALSDFKTKPLTKEILSDIMEKYF